MCIMLLYHNHETVSYANLICINVLEILIIQITEYKINIYIYIKKKQKKKKNKLIMKQKGIIKK